MYVAQGLAFIVAWIDGGANVTTGLPRDFQDIYECRFDLKALNLTPVQ